MKKRILFVNASLQLGGVEKSLLDILKNIDYNKYDIWLYLDNTEVGFVKDIPQNVNIVNPNMNGTYGGYLSIFKKLLKEREFSKLYLRTIRLLAGKINSKLLLLMRPIYKMRYGVFDCVVGFREGGYTYFAMKAFKAKKYIGWWHGAIKPVSLKEYIGIENLSHLVGVSNGVSEMLKDTFPKMKKRIITVPNMIDSNAIQLKSNEDIGISHRKDECVNLVTVCRVSLEKHLENVVFCAKKLKDNKVNFKWKIVGDGAEFSKIKGMIGDSNLSDSLILVGEKSNPYPYIKEADLYVHSSYIESQGLTILEAMALNVPCVVTKTNGPCEFIEDRVNGILTEQSPVSLAENVEKILKDKELYGKIKSSTRCPEQFSPESVMQKIYEIIEN